MRKLLRVLILIAALIGLWQLIVSLFALPHYIFPTPKAVFICLVEQFNLLWEHAQITLLEIVLGLVLGVSFGISSAFILLYFKRLSAFLLPILVISQAIPVFAIAPLLVLWLGYGLASKIAMTILIIYFPVTTACYDGLRNTPKQWIQLAETYQLSPLRLLFKVRLPAALPALGSGLRIAASIAPIGAVIGEWVGSSQGLGYLMLNANARMQVDLMFSALFILILVTLTIYFLTDILLRKLIPWASHLH